MERGNTSKITQERRSDLHKGNGDLRSIIVPFLLVCTVIGIGIGIVVVVFVLLVEDVIVVFVVAIRVVLGIGHRRTSVIFIDMADFPIRSALVERGV